MSSFAANLKHLAATCQFGTHLNEALRVRLVCGVKSKEIQKKLLTDERNFDEALKNALRYEAPEKDVVAFSHEGSTPANKLGKGNLASACRGRFSTVSLWRAWLIQVKLD